MSTIEINYNKECPKYANEDLEKECKSTICHYDYNKCGIYQRSDKFTQDSQLARKLNCIQLVKK